MAKNVFEVPRILEKSLINEFKGSKAFTKEELFAFYRSFEPDLKESTLAWRIHDLKQRHIIQSVKKDRYIISSQPAFSPEVSPELLKLAKIINNQFAEVRYSIWETPWLNEFLQHQASKQMVLIDIEADFEELLYYQLKDNTRFNLYLHPDKKVIDLYVAESNFPVIIKKLITRSPLVKRKAKNTNFSAPQLEKILVDIFAEEKLFYYLQGPELTHIYANAITGYTINFTRLFSYAKRRQKEQEIKSFLMKNMADLVKDIIDD